MSAFPTIPWALDSKEGWVDDRQPDRATNGAMRGRVFFDNKKKSFDLAIKVLSAAQKLMLEAHYDNHRAASFEFTWRDTVTYQVVYGKDAIRLEPLAGGNWSATVSLEQT